MRLCCSLLSYARRHGSKLLLLNIRTRGRLQLDSASGFDHFLDLAHHNKSWAYREEQIRRQKCFVIVTRTADAGNDRPERQELLRQRAALICASNAYRCTRSSKAQPVSQQLDYSSWGSKRHTHPIESQDEQQMACSTSLLPEQICIL